MATHWYRALRLCGGQPLWPLALDTFGRGANAPAKTLARASLRGVPGLDPGGGRRVRLASPGFVHPAGFRARFLPALALGERCHDPTFLFSAAAWGLDCGPFRLTFEAQMGYRRRFQPTLGPVAALRSKGQRLPQSNPPLHRLDCDGAGSPQLVRVARSWSLTGRYAGPPLRSSRASNQPPFTVVCRCKRLRAYPIEPIFAYVRHPMRHRTELS